MTAFFIWIERLLRWIVTLLALAFLGTGIAALCYGHATVTMFDMWNLYDVALRRPFWQAVALKYGSHSVLFPTLIWMADIKLFHANQQILFIGLIFMVASAAMLAAAVWQDRTIGTTSRLVAVLVIIVGNFSMGRAAITAIGAFNCICSLVVLGTLVAFHTLAMVCCSSGRYWPKMILLTACALISSFSFGSGFAVWPTLLFLGWSARLSWRSLSFILVVGLMAVVLYALLPGPGAYIAPENAISPITALHRYCDLVGAPFLYAIIFWTSHPVASEAKMASSIPVIFGAIGLASAVFSIGRRLILRDLGHSRLQWVALALTFFTLAAIGFIVAGRTAEMHATPGQVLAPRYLFWSSLFWAGLALTAIQKAETVRFLRWPVWVTLSALPILVLPQQYQGAIWSRTVQLLMESAATSLINGVCDQTKVLVMYPDSSVVYNLAKQFQLQRLDMFRDGMQDWIGISADELARKQASHSIDLKGAFSVQTTVQCEGKAPSARVVGWAIEQERQIPSQIVFVDSQGVICGLARPTQISPTVNREHNLFRFTASEFLGYIRSYNPQTSYFARSIDDDSISTQMLPVTVPVRCPIKQQSKSPRSSSQ